MADNFVANAGAGGKTFATDDVAGVDYPILKVALGALDAVTLLAGGAGAVSAGVPRVTLASDDPAVVALQVLDNAISGTEMQVDVVAALPAGTNNIGDVDVLTLPATTVAGATVKTADLDTGAGTDTVPILGVAVGAAGGAVAVTGDATNGLDVDVTRVSGTVTVDGSGVTQPVSNAGLTELAAAINASSQMDVNIAASAATVTVANAGLTELAAALNAEDVASASADAGMVILARRTDAPANQSGTDGDYEFLQVSGGRLWASATIDAAIPAGTNNIGDVDVLSVPAPLNVVGTGTEAAALRVTIATDSTGLVSVDDNGGSLTVDVGTALPAGANAIGKLAANSGVDIGDVDVTSIAAGTNLIGDVGIQGRTTGGLSFYKSIDLDETEEEVKATAGTLYSILAFNRTVTPLYLKFYNATAANVIVGTTVPDMTLVVPANADSDGAGFTHSVAQGYAFGTAISMAATTGVADADAGAPGANDCVVLVGYK